MAKRKGPPLRSEPLNVDQVLAEHDAKLRETRMRTRYDFTLGRDVQEPVATTGTTPVPHRAQPVGGPPQNPFTSSRDRKAAKLSQAGKQKQPRSGTSRRK